MVGAPDPRIPPLVGSLLLSIATLLLLKEAKNPTSQYAEQLTPFTETVSAVLCSEIPFSFMSLHNPQAIDVLGRPIYTSGDNALASARRKIEETTASVRAIPSRILLKVEATKEDIVNGVQSKKEQVIEGILSTKEEFIQRIQNAPDQAKGFVVEKIEESKRAVAKKAEVSLFTPPPAHLHIPPRTCFTQQDMKTELVAIPGTVQATVVRKAADASTRLKKLPEEVADATAAAAQKKIAKLQADADEVLQKAKAAVQAPLDLLPKEK